jgi:hypothetical protein
MPLVRPLVFPFTSLDCDRAAKWAKLAERAGRSTVREAAFERDQTVSDDQLTGQLASMVGCRWLTGGLDEWRLVRAYALEQGGASHPTPVRGSDTSFKGTLIRGRQALWRYTLSVAPVDTRVGWTYVLVLIPDLKPSSLIPGCPTFALIMGQALLSAFPDTVEGKGTFKDKYILRVPQLVQCQPRHGIDYASDELIAALEDALGIAPQDRWAVVQPQSVHWVPQATTVTV